MRIIRSWQVTEAEIDKILRRGFVEDVEEKEEAVKEIIQAVGKEGDEAVLRFTKKFDCPKITIDKFKVKRAEIEEAYEEVDKELLRALRKAKRNIQRFHRRQLDNLARGWSDEGLGVEERFLPIENIGIYVPGGLAAYPSTVLMTAIPAKVAGVEKVILCSPPDKKGKINSYTLVAAAEAKADEIYKIGGAQAIAAMAFGTETVPKVDKIVGPGNIYVILAKKLLFGFVGIESLPGPSEIMILADNSGNPKFIASDLLSQAEHQRDVFCILVTPSEKLAQEVNSELKRQRKYLKRKEIIRSSLGAYGAIIITKTTEEAIDLVNRCAPEHLQIMVEEPEKVLDKIRNAGAIFIGDFSPVALGDYIAGPSHVLPTGGTARFSSGLSVTDFLKIVHIIRYSKGKLKQAKEEIRRLAECEGLEGHAKAVEVRLEP